MFLIYNFPPFNNIFQFVFHVFQCSTQNFIWNFSHCNSFILPGIVDIFRPFEPPQKEIRELEIWETWWPILFHSKPFKKANYPIFLMKKKTSLETHTLLIKLHGTAIERFEWDQFGRIHSLFYEYNDLNAVNNMRNMILLLQNNNICTYQCLQFVLFEIYS